MNFVKSKYSDKENEKYQALLFKFQKCIKGENYKRAYKIVKELDKKNISVGSYNLSAMYRQGQYVKKDAKQEFKYLKKAFDNGHITATFHIAIVHITGRIVKQDKKYGYKLMKDLADANYKPAINFLKQEFISSDSSVFGNNIAAHVFINDYFDEEVVDELQQACTEYVEAMLKDFFNLLNNKQYEKAYKISQELEFLKHPEGSFMLAILYLQGCYFKLDSHKAIDILLNIDEKYNPATYLTAVLIGSLSESKKGKSDCLLLMKKLAKHDYEPAIDALDESPTGMPEKIEISYEYLCKF